MKKQPFYLLLLLFVSVIASSQSTRKLHYKAILVDTHNDVLSSQTLIENYESKF